MQQEVIMDELKNEQTFPYSHHIPSSATLFVGGKAFAILNIMQICRRQQISLNYRSVTVCLRSMLQAWSRSYLKQTSARLKF